MEKVNENIEINCNYYTNFLQQNFSEDFYNTYINQSEQDLKKNFFKIISEGITLNFVNYELNLGFIDFTEDKDYNIMLDILNENTEITSLLLASNPNLNEKDLTTILNTFANVKSFKNLYIYNSGLQGNFLADSISTLIKKDHLETLHLSSNNLNDIGLKSISENFLQNKILNNLTLTNVNISSNSLSTIAKIIDECQSLNFLIVSDCNLNIAREQNFNFVTNVKNNEKKDDSTNFLTAISKSSSLQNLSLVNCNLGREAVYILQALENNSNSNIKLIDFTENNIQSDDFRDLLVCLKKLKLQYLTLNQNNISDLGIFYLYDYLESTFPKNTEHIIFSDKVQFLDLEQNNISDKGAKILINIIQSDFFYLKNLNLKFNKVSPSMIAEIANTLVEYSKQSQLKLDIEKSGLYNIFNILNISQIGIDLSKNFNVSDKEYDSIYSEKIKQEYERFFYN